MAQLGPRSKAIAPASKDTTNTATAFSRLVGANSGSTARRMSSVATPAAEASSSRNQLQASSGAESATTSSALRTRRLRHSHITEPPAQVVARTDDHESDARRLQLQQLGAWGRLRAGEARRVDQDERDVAAAERPVDEPLDEPRGKRRGHDAELERPSDQAVLVREQRRERGARLRLDGGKQVERRPPVALTGAHALVLALRTVDHEERPPAAPYVGEQERARSADLHVEALPHDRLRVGVEHDCDLVARGVLQLLDHQLRPPRGRAPVNLAQRVAVLVLP